MTQNYGRATYISWVDGTTLDVLDCSGIAATTDSLERTPYGHVYRRYVPGLSDYGSITLTVCTDTADVVNRIRRSYTDRTISALSIVAPNGYQYTFDGFLTALTHVFDKNGLYTFQITIKITGYPNVTMFPDFTVVPQSGTNLVRGGTFGLFLVAGVGSETTGGEAAEWGITGDHATKTKIVGNTLTIDPTETNPITVTAKLVKPDGSYAPTITATYPVIPAIAQAIAITKVPVDLKIATDATEDVTGVVESKIYPLGAPQETTYSLYDENGNTPNTNAISIAVATITVKKGVTGFKKYYPLPAGTTAYTYRFMVRAHPTSNPSIIDEDEFRVEIYDND